MGLDLQDVVGQVADVTDVAKHVVNAVFEELRRDELIALGQRLEGVGVQHVVEGIDRAVDAFPRIFFGGRLGSERNQQDAGK
ncbi:hypothetical protein D3C81_1755510 [compost metagenome]